MDTITFTAIIKNKGNDTAGASTMTLGFGPLVLPAIFSIPSLASEDTYTVQCYRTVSTAQSYTCTATADVNDDVTESDETNNVDTLNFTVEEGSSGAADLVISSLLHSPQNPTTVNTITFQAIVYNDGSAMAEGSVLTIRIGDESTPASYEIPPLDPGGSCTVERHEVLNVTSGDLTVVPGESGCDLTVSSLTWSPENPITEDMITFTAVVANIGNESAGGSNLNIRLGGENAGSFHDIPSLDPGETYAVERQQILDIGESTVIAVADVNMDVNETNEANNMKYGTVTVVLPTH